MNKTCINCGNNFKKRCNESLKDWNKRHKFCSKKCFDDFRKGKPSPSPSTIFKTGHKLYSLVDTRTKRVGTLNNKWKGGVTPIHEKIRKEIGYKKWRKNVFERDNYVCQKCGKRGGNLHVHHDLSFADYPDLRIEILNGMTLCVSCHRKVHKRQIIRK